VGGQAEAEVRLNAERVPTLTGGTALASELSVFSLSGSNDLLVASGGQTFRFVASLATATNLQRWFNSTSATVNVSAIQSSLQPNSIRGFVAGSAATFVLTADGKVPVDDPAEWTNQVVSVPDNLLAAIPTVNAKLSAPAMVSSPGNRLSYFVDSQSRRTATGQDMSNRFLNLLNQPAVIMLPQSAINTISSSGIALSPGSIIRQENNFFVADGLNSLVRLESLAQAQSVSGSKIFSYTSAELAGLTVRSRLNSIKVQCGSDTYLLDKGTLYPISDIAVRHFPGNPYPLASSTCSALEISERVVGQFIRDNRGLLFLIQDGKKRRISNWTHLANLRGDGPGHIEASAYFASKIPTGDRAPQTVELALGGSIPKGEFGEITFDGSVPTPAPTPAPTPTPTPTPAPTQSPKPSPSTSSPAVTEYRVRSGDNLIGIANRFGVSVASLQSHNGITNPNSLQVGMVLRIPGPGSSSSSPTPSQSPASQSPATQSPTTSPAVRTYKVQAGDNLWAIARKFSASADALAKLNNITNANLIKIGQTLKIPG
jgi:LysM repeat protein